MIVNRLTRVDGPPRLPTSDLGAWERVNTQAPKPMASLKHIAATISRYITGGKGMSRAQFERTRDKLIKKTPPPTFWLFGKTGSGKSSIVKFLTGADDIQIGSGFRPTTRCTNLYEFPDENMPIMRFLDTRGLGEAGYDPAEDLAAFSASVHAMIVTQKLMDFAT